LFIENNIDGFQPNNIENKIVHFNTSIFQEAKFQENKISFLIKPFHNVTFLINDFSRDTHTLAAHVPVILQRPFTETNPLVYFLTRQIVFTVQ
jgi:hypothetical protein